MAISVPGGGSGHLRDIGETIQVTSLPQRHYISIAIDGAYDEHMRFMINSFYTVVKVSLSPPDIYDTATARFDKNLALRA